MFKNYILTAWRNLWKNKVFSVVNIFGLAISLAAFWLIALFVADELSYDRYHEKADRIFRLASHGRWDGGSFDITGTSAPTAAALQKNYPEVEQATRLDAEGGSVINYGEKHLKVDKLFLADSNFFSVFTYHFLAGDRATALAAPESMVITRDLAKQLFGSVDAAINKLITVDNGQPNKITAVIENVPGNSHFSLSALRSFPSGFKNDWSNFYLYTYLLLKNKKDGHLLQKKMPEFEKRYFTDKGMDIQYSIELQPLTSIHLHSNLSFELAANRTIRFITVLSIVGILILGIAMINYMNITTAQASVRLREVAVRKVIGSGRKNLMQLFLTESLLTTFCAAFLSLVLAQILMPVFNTVAGKNLQLWSFGPVLSFSVLVGFSVLLGLLGGLYPALFLSGFKPVPALKNQMGQQQLQTIFRKSLVVFQFAVAVIMIAATIVIYYQLKYVNKTDLGFDKNQVLAFHLENEQARFKGAELRDALLKNISVEAVAFAGHPIGNNDVNISAFNIEKDGAIDPNITLANELITDANYISMMHIQMAQGRAFDPLLKTDSNSVIINQAFARKQGWTQPLGKRIFAGKDSAGQSHFKSIIGVVHDFHVYSLQHKIDPMVMVLPQSPKEMDNVYLRIRPENIKATLDFVEEVFKQFDTNTPFTYSFLDENFKKQYDAEQKQGTVLLIFTILTIGVASLGLFALISFTTSQRVKEIGVRKVLGASVPGLVRLLSADLMKLVLIALLVALLISWWMMDRWLDAYRFRADGIINSRIYFIHKINQRGVE